MSEMANYKEEMKLTEQEIEAIKPTQDECAKITADMELYKPQEFKGCFANDEYNKLVKRKIAEAAQEKCLRVLSSGELPELPNIWFCERKHQCKWQGFLLNGGISFGRIPVDSNNNSWFKWHERECGGKLTQVDAIIQPQFNALKAENERLNKESEARHELIRRMLAADEARGMTQNAHGFKHGLLMVLPKIEDLKVQLTASQQEVERLKGMIPITVDEAQLLVGLVEHSVPTDDWNINALKTCAAFYKLKAQAALSKEGEEK